ncbi:SufD family Fe-S cluster assembly protein [Flavobacteriaceae bacterium]|nr:SufD family Fe-S cluster assembly protein [Flavobacteriaceae bacterium]
MDLKEKIVSSYVAFEDGVNINSDIHEIRTEAFQNFEKLGFPSKKLEAWKYTSLNTILKEDYSIFPDKEKTINLADVRQYFIHDIDTYKVIFIDGKYSSFLSETTHDSIDVCLMSSALTKAKYKPVIENYFNKVAKQDNLTSLNTAFSKEGAYIHIPKNTEVEKPIQIINFTTGTETATMLQPRNLIVVGQNAHVQIIERHQSLTENAVLTNVVTEVYADRHSTVDFYKIQNDHASASLVDNTYIEQHVDHHTLVHHIEPNCESHQDYKGIFDERSTGVFNGKVIVEKEAQKTNAYQKNNNVLVSDRSTINAKPQLEIFADDVKCSHGCTIGQLDEQALFYMQQRGIPKKEARALLMYAFANTVLESVKIPEVKERITKLIAMKLNVNIGFNI